MDDLSDIYSAANIARSRFRAEAFRQMVADGRLSADDGWLQAADDLDAHATEREQLALVTQH